MSLSVEQVHLLVGDNNVNPELPKSLSAASKFTVQYRCELQSGTERFF